MNSFTKLLFEKEVLKKVLSSEGFLGGPSPERLDSIKSYILGFRKGSVIFDLEKSLTIYFNALRLVESCSKSSGVVLFVGCPPILENQINEILKGSQHLFMNESFFVLGSLTNNKQSQLLPDLIVTFNISRAFPAKECLIKGIPLISFVDESSDISFIDYPIFINLRSEGASFLYHTLIKQSISNTNVEYTL